MDLTQSKKRWAVLVIMIASIFMSTLDSSIVNVALPKMAKDLSVTASDIQWVVSSYLITIAALVLLFGRFGDLLGKTRIFEYGIGLFTVGSLLCGITHSFPILIIARVIQAVGAAGTMANSQGIITESFPPTERGRALGFSGTAVALGSLVGPGLGGLIVGAASWEYIFIINIPIGIITLLFAWKLLPKNDKPQSIKMDWAGSSLFIIFIVSLFATLSFAQSRSFTDPFVLCGFLVAIASFIGFFLIERRSEKPLIQMVIFKNKLFTLSIFCAFITFVALFCNVIIQPFYLQDVLGYAPEHAGLVLMIYPVIMAVVAPLSGHMSDKIGSELLTFIGLSLTSVGLLLMSSLNEKADIIHMVIFIDIMSIGMGLFQSPNNSLIMSTVSCNMLGVAGSINALIRNLGMVCGIALATTLLYGRMSALMGHRVTDYVVGRSDVFVSGMRIVYLVSAGICLLGAVLTLVRMIQIRKDKKALNASTTTIEKPL